MKHVSLHSFYIFHVQTPEPLLFLCLSIVSVLSIHVSTSSYLTCLGYWLYLPHLLHLQFWELNFHLQDTALHFIHFQVSLASQSKIWRGSLCEVHYFFTITCLKIRPKRVSAWFDYHVCQATLISSIPSHWKFPSLKFHWHFPSIHSALA